MNSKRLHALCVVVLSIIAVSRAIAATAIGNMNNGITPNRFLEGWAFDQANTSVSINIDILIDGNWVARTNTTILRTDVNGLYGIGGYHGFYWQIPPAYNDNNDHTLNVYALDVSDHGSNLLAACPTNFINHEPIGFFDHVNSTNGFTYGWAFDPDQPDVSLIMTIYLDNPAGLSGRFLGPTNADIYRGDVNTDYGITGNHGFNWTLPAEYTNAYHVIYPYAIDSYAASGIGTGDIVNPLIANAPLAYGTRPNGDATITNEANGHALVLQTSDWAAGAITSVEWNGSQFVVNGDHGQSLQSSVAFYTGYSSGEEFNPTEAGSVNDGGPGTPSSSVLQAISVNSNTPSIDTQTQMAFWRTGICDVCAITWLSGVVLNKHVALGYNGSNNVIQYTATFNVPTPDEPPFPAEYPFAQFNVASGFMPLSFDIWGAYVPGAGFTNFTTNVWSRYPIYFGTSDGQNAMGVFCPDVFTNWPHYPTVADGSPAYLGFISTSSDVEWWTVIFHYTNNIPASNYTFHLYIPVGDSATVRATLKWLWRQWFPPVITGISPSSGSPGTEVTITGNNFSPIAPSNTVYFGAVQATVLTATANTLTANVPVGATYAPISVTVDEATAYSDQPFGPTFSGNGVLDDTALADPVDLGVGGGPYSVAIGDIDGDGKPDVVVAHASDGTVYVFRNISTNGTLAASSFDAPVVVQLGGTNGNGLYGLALGDLTGDGQLDVVAPNWGNNSIAILQNLSSPGSISFGSPVYLPVGSTPLNVAVGDLDGDGFADIVTVNWGNSTVSVLRNLGAGGVLTSNSFAPQFELTGASGTHAPAIADLDGDGKPEIIVANNSGASDTLSVFQNISTNGSLSVNSFGTRVDFAGGGERLAVGDLDGDGKPDVAAASWQDQVVHVFRNTSTTGTINTSSLAANVAFDLGGYGHEVEISDIDGDGKPDLAVVTELPDQLLLFKNTSTSGSITSSSFADPVVFSDGYNEAAVAIGDMDGDGQPDIFVGNYYDNTLSLYRNTVAPP